MYVKKCKKNLQKKLSKTWKNWYHLSLIPNMPQLVRGRHRWPEVKGHHPPGGNHTHYDATPVRATAATQPLHRPHVFRASLPHNPAWRCDSHCDATSSKSPVTSRTSLAGSRTVVRTVMSVAMSVMGRVTASWSTPWDHKLLFLREFSKYFVFAMPP